MTTYKEVNTVAEKLGFICGNITLEYDNKIKEKFVVASKENGGSLDDYFVEIDINEMQKITFNDEVAKIDVPKELFSLLLDLANTPISKRYLNKEKEIKHIISESYTEEFKSKNTFNQLKVCLNILKKISNIVN